MKNNFKENEELDIIVLIEKIKLMFLSVFLQIFRRSKKFLSPNLEYFSTLGPPGKPRSNILAVLSKASPKASSIVVEIPVTRIILLADMCLLTKLGGMKMALQMVSSA